VNNPSKAWKIWDKNILITEQQSPSEKPTSQNRPASDKEGAFASLNPKALAAGTQIMSSLASPTVEP
jgi:hypothetical protein